MQHLSGRGDRDGGEDMARERGGARGGIGDHYHQDIHPVGNFSELATFENQHDLQPKSKAAGCSISRKMKSFPRGMDMYQICYPLDKEQNMVGHSALAQKL